MDVRIGSCTPARARGRAARRHRRRRPARPGRRSVLADDDGVLWLTDSKGARSASLPQGRLRRARHRRRQGPHRLRLSQARSAPRDHRCDRRCSTAGCCSSPARAASARRRSPPRSRCSPPSRASARSSARSTPRATWPTSSRSARTAFEPREIAPEPVRDVDGHRGVAQGVPAAPAARSRCVARIGPLARTFDFVANAAPGVKEVLTVGKFLLGGARAPLRPRRRRRRRHRPHRRPAGGAAGASASW